MDTILSAAKVDAYSFTTEIQEEVKAPVVKTVTHDYAFLKRQIEAINAQRSGQIAKIQADWDREIAEVMALLAEADKLGVIEKVDIKPDITPIKAPGKEVIL